MTPVAYYNESWTLTPAGYKEAMKEYPEVFVGMKPAYASPAWEPLTPELMLAVRQDTKRTEYWLAVGGSNEPWQACWEPVLEAFYADGDGITLRPAQVTHIMRFITPELPS